MIDELGWGVVRFYTWVLSIGVAALLLVMAVRTALEELRGWRRARGRRTLANAGPRDAHDAGDMGP